MFFGFKSYNQVLYLYLCLELRIKLKSPLTKTLVTTHFIKKQFYTILLYSLSNWLFALVMASPLAA